MDCSIAKRCDYCNKYVSPGEISRLSTDWCPVINDQDEYLICEYCLGNIESTGDKEEVHRYWNKWVENQKLL